MYPGISSKRSLHYESSKYIGMNFLSSKVVSLCNTAAKCVSSHFVPFTPSGLFYVNYLDRSIYNIRDVWLFFIVTMVY